MNLSLVERIANAVLYEGYLLYPYRSSAVKNRQRWNFGVVYPGAYGEMQVPEEPVHMNTHCLALGTPSPTLSVKIRCQFVKIESDAVRLMRLRSSLERPRIGCQAAD